MKHHILHFSPDELETLKKALVEHRIVKVTHLGVFQVKHKALRYWKNPKTGLLESIKSRNVLRFRPTAKLLRHLQAR